MMTPKFSKPGRVSLPWILLSILFLAHHISGECRSRPLGLLSGEIKDWQLAASSVVSRAKDPNCAVKYARLHAPGRQAWCPEHVKEGEWILVDLGVESEVAGVMTQGRDGYKHWVTHFHLSYSLDAYRWEYARDIYGNKKLFRGNQDSHSVKISYLEHTARARFLRLHIQAWNGHPSLRLEVLGCQECNTLISELPGTEMKSSSHRNLNILFFSKRRRSNRNTCSPEDANIYTSGGWCPRRNNDKQWLQVDLGPPTLVTGIITRGRGDKKNWVTSYTLSYSNDTNFWFYYKDANHLEAKVFGGNMDIKTERRHYLNVPMVARYVRIHPVTWKRKIGLRVGVLGCPHQGECGPGFTNVNQRSGCVPNQAYKKETWTNDKRHGWKQWKYGHSSLAVDGKENTNLPNCAILDNYYADKPIWMVDLSREQTIHGVLILTWQGQGQDKITSYTDYVHNLDKLSVYVSNRPKLNSTGLTTEPKCGAITRENTALFNPRLHFDCGDPLAGRYVYVKATGVPNRWKKHFTVVLCEVMAY